MAISGAAATTLHTLKLAATPSSAATIFRRRRSLSLSLPLFTLLKSPFSPFPLSSLSFSAAAAAATSDTATAVAPVSEKVVRSQWRAAIDFKWIKENREAVAENIVKRNSSANLGLVIELYEKMLALQKRTGS
ncbi:hypothetical protein Droror1_Dr00008015 [Drosera rotundifolia]